MQEALTFIDGINEVRSGNTDSSSVTMMIDSQSSYAAVRRCVDSVHNIPTSRHLAKNGAVLLPT